MDGGRSKTAGTASSSRVPERASNRAEAQIAPGRGESPAPATDSIALTPEAEILRLQASVGNAAIGAMLEGRAPAPASGAGLIQRQVEPGNDTAVAPTATWHMPFDLGVARTTTEAALGLLEMIGRFERFEQTSEDLQASAHQAIAGLRDQLANFREPGPLTPLQVGDLTIVGGFAEAAHRQLMETFTSRLAEAFSWFQPRDTSDEEAELAEKLHFAFIEGEGERRISEIAETIGKLKEYTEKAKSVCEWAGRAQVIVRQAARFEQLAHVAGEASEQAGRVQSMLNLADSISVFAGRSGSRPGDVQNSISRFRAGLRVIDFTVGTIGSKVPLFGQLWSNYYLPVTEAILNQIQSIARYTDTEVRQLAELDWTSQGGRGNQPPVIERGDLSRFPGGQPVMDFMWRLMHDQEPEMTRSVEDFFIGFREQFGAGLGEREQIEVESHSHWYNPFSWGARPTAPQLTGWLSRNRDRVWMQLYGALPHNV